MKKYILIVILILFFVGCKSSKKSVVTDIHQKIENKQVNEEIKGITASFTLNDILSTELELTRFEPVYFKYNGKDTVVLKPVIYKQINESVTTEETVAIDTTSNKAITAINSNLTDKSTSNSEFQGYDILKSIIGGLTGFFAKPFIWVLWIVAILLIIPLFRFIRSKLKKKV